MILPLVLAGALLAQSADEKKIRELIGRLATEDPAARRKALDELTAKGRPAVPVAAAVLAGEGRSPDREVDRAVKDLALPSWERRNAATLALVRLGRRARPRLQTYEAHENPEVAWRARAAIAEIDQSERAETMRELWRDAALCAFLGAVREASGLTALLAVLERPVSGSVREDPILEVRVRAAEALGRSRGELSPEQAAAAAGRILELLRELVPDRRSAATLVRALGGLRAPAAAGPLSTLVRDPAQRDLHLKRLAMRALAEIGEAKGVRAVVEALESADPYVREAALGVLADRAGKDFGLDPREESPAAKLREVRAWWEKAYGKKWEE